MNIIKGTGEFNKHVPVNPHYGTISIEKKLAQRQALKRSGLMDIPEGFSSHAEAYEAAHKEAVDDFCTRYPEFFNSQYPELLEDSKWNKEILAIALKDIPTKMVIETRLKKNVTEWALSKGLSEFMEIEEIINIWKSQNNEIN